MVLAPDGAGSLGRKLRLAIHAVSADRGVPSGKQGRFISWDKHASHAPRKLRSRTLGQSRVIVLISSGSRSYELDSQRLIEASTGQITLGVRFVHTGCS